MALSDYDGAQDLPPFPETGSPSPPRPREILCAATRLHALIDTLSAEAQQALLRTLELLLEEDTRRPLDDT